MLRSARVCTGGGADGRALVLSQALSFWGGVDPVNGHIIDRSHPDLGACITGRVLVMPGGRGSSSSSSVLAETIRRGTGPAGIILASPDPILTVGSLVAEFLYGRRCPVVVCAIDGIANDAHVTISAPADGVAADVRIAG